MNRRDVLKLSGTLFAGTIITQGLVAGNAIKEISELPTTFSTNNEPLLLHYNENSLGLSPKAQKEIADHIQKVNRYPDDYIIELKDTIASTYQISADEITLGVGSSDVIRAVINKLGIEALQQRKKIQLITPDPSFFLAAEHAKAIGINVVYVPLNESYCMDIKKMKAIADNFNGISICYLCNPNNPTGTLTSSVTIEDWVKQANATKQFFMIDEAYAEYITDKNFVSGLSFVKENRDNVIVLRTFSKIFAMAGLRLGYGISTPKLAKELVPYMSILNVNTLTAVAGIASIQDKDFISKSLKMNQDSMKITTDALDSLGLEYLPSHGNFVFHRIKGEPQEYIDRMKDAGIIVGRPFPPLTEWTRITLGTPQEMTQYAETLKNFRSKEWI